MCLFKSFKEASLPTPCMCDACEGKQTHPQTPSSSSSTTTPPRPPAATSIPIPIVTIERNTDQLRGAVCFCCNKSKEKTLSLGQEQLKIGKHKTIKFYTKRELKETHTCAPIHEMIKAEMDIVERTKDARPDHEDSMEDSQGSQTDNEEKVVFTMVKCAGFKDEAGLEDCGVECKSILTLIKADGEVKTFCHPKHLTRYLLKFYTSKGKRPSRKKANTTFALTPTSTPTSTITSTTSTIPFTDLTANVTPPATGRERGRGRGAGRGGSA
jgi:hypothetical protein